MKTIQNKIILALAVSGLTTASALADDMDTNQVSGTLTAQQFVTDASVGGLKEIYASQLALAKSTNEDVTDFARHMVRDHSRANAKLAKIADAEGLTLPPTNTFAADDPTWSNPLITDASTLKGGQLLISTNLPYLADYRAIHQLETLSADQFDAAYASSMAEDHQATIGEFEQASQSLSDDKLKKFADKTLPTLRRHSEMAQDLNNKLNSTNTVTMMTNQLPAKPYIAPVP